ncbi:MAG TPA: hypothetical protein VL986_07180 [Terracidiphilus sp.]|nr:hypothetical protein [Terracidiphilus sp.]
MKSISTSALWSEATMPIFERFHRVRGFGLPLMLASGLAAAGCGNPTTKNVSSVTTPSTPPALVYFAPAMNSGTLSTFAFDNSANTFVRTTYSVTGATITDAGDIEPSSNGIVGLEPTFLAGVDGTITQPAPAPQGWAVEIPGQAALVEMAVPGVTLANGQIPPLNYFTPAVPSSTCPSFTSPQSFLFVTLPKPLAGASATSISEQTWNPELETAYGSVQVSTKGTSVQLASISQNLFPGFSGGSNAPGNPAPSNTSASCSPSYYGQVISMPGTVTVTSPGGNETATPTATIAIGASGMLVEDAGSSTVQGEPYYNILGAGFGSIGLPKPSSDPTLAVIGATYQGFVTAPGSNTGFNLISSFGPASSSQSTCTAFVSELSGANLSPSANTVYGGEYPLNGAASSPLGTANCDIAVDLGSPGSVANGMYTAATVYIGTSFPGNGINAPYSFPAVAVAGQIDGKSAIFLLGVDTTGSPSRAWGIYLLESD